MGEMFALIEKKWGGMEKLRDTATVERGTLDASAIERLVSHRSLALVVEEYIPPTAALELGAKLANEDRFNWTVSSMARTESSDVAVALGTPLNMNAPDYDATVLKAKRRLRELCGGLSPLDRLRVDLDDAVGAIIARDDASKNPRHAGLPRFMRHSTGFIHVDDLAPLTAKRGLFSANIYLTTVPFGGGGHLEVWPVAFRSRWQFYANALTFSALTTQDKASQARLRASLPPPVTIHPRPGDLVLFCVQRPHAVAAFPDQDRVSLQSFITYREGHPLMLEN